MRETTMRQAIEELMRELSAALTHERVPRAERLPRNLRPHTARSTFRPADVQVASRVIV